MNDLLKPLLAALVLAVATVATANAQEDGLVFAVAYIEVTPSSTETAVRLLRDQARASRSDAGNVRYEILQRIGRPNHFAIIDAWDSQAARDRSVASEHSRTFRSGLEPLLYSPYDERPSTPIMGTNGPGGDGEVYVITHVDIIPTGMDEGMALLEDLVKTSREEAGAVDIGIMAQNNRRNHLTLFETWATADQQIAHTAAAHTRHFRSELQSRSGALYDERLYRHL